MIQRGHSVNSESTTVATRTYQSQNPKAGELFCRAERMAVLKGMAMVEYKQEDLMIEERQKEENMWKVLLDTW